MAVDQGLHHPADELNAIEGCEPSTQDADSDGFTWRPEVIYQDTGACAPERELATSTPANDVLLRLARDTRNQPPQSWWKDDDDPFETAD